MVDETQLQLACSQILKAIGENTEREGLRDTPRRFARFWKEFIDYNDTTQLVAFNSVSVDQMIVIRGLRLYSLCEHHLMPFWCDVAVGYIADTRILGLSKFARIAKKASRKLQVQERLVTEIAHTVSTVANTPNVAVVAKGVHLCMVMRGIEKEGEMISSVMLGRFREYGEVRSEFLNLALYVKG